jgi:hypothetical protein
MNGIVLATNATCFEKLLCIFFSSTFLRISGKWWQIPRKPLRGKAYSLPPRWQAGGKWWQVGGKDGDIS